MTPQIHVDMTDWKLAAKALFGTETKRTLEDFINGQALRVSIESVRQTEKADIEKITHRLGAKSTVTIGPRGGKRKSLTVKEDSFAARILGARFKATGQWGVKGNTMEERVRNFIAMARRSVAFIKSGWIPARNILFARVRQKPSNATAFLGARIYGKPKGTARPAIGTWFRPVTAEIENQALMAWMDKPPAPGGDPMPVATKGLQKALAICALDMMRKLGERLMRDFQKYNAR